MISPSIFKWFSFYFYFCKSDITLIYVDDDTEHVCVSGRLHASEVTALCVFGIFEPGLNVDVIQRSGDLCNIYTVVQK